MEMDDGALLTEGVAIIQYLADLKPDRLRLAPVGSLTHYHVLGWLRDGILSGHQLQLIFAMACVVSITS